MKVNHHGSDTSTSAAIVSQMLPEVAIISAKFTASYKLPKQIAIKQFQDNRCYVLVTGDGHNPQTQDFTKSGATTDDDAFTVNEAGVFNDQGNVTILVSPDGFRYTVIAGSFAKTFTSSDSLNQR